MSAPPNQPQPPDAGDLRWSRAGATGSGAAAELASGAFDPLFREAWTESQIANLLQAVVFVSFLWELGYRAWGPLLTVPFALVQGLIFLRTRSLGYVVTVHLLFDAVVFAVLVHAHNPQLFDIFPTAPGAP